MWNHLRLLVLSQLFEVLGCSLGESCKVKKALSQLYVIKALGGYLGESHGVVKSHQ